MIIFLKNHLKAVASRGAKLPGMSRRAKRPGYIDRSSLEEDLRSTQWAHVEQLMQSLNTTWGHAHRLISRAPDQRDLRLSRPL